MTTASKTADKPAFPSGMYEKSGLNKREWFAGQALAGLCAASATGAHNFRDGDDLTRSIVNSAVEAADLLIAELDRTKP